MLLNAGVCNGELAAECERAQCWRSMQACVALA